MTPETLAKEAAELICNGVAKTISEAVAALESYYDCTFLTHLKRQIYDAYPAFKSLAQIQAKRA